MKKVSKTDIALYVLRFINRRHWGDTSEAVKAQKWLQKTLGTTYDKTLLKHGDPDVKGNYENVVRKWESEL